MKTIRDVTYGLLRAFGITTIFGIPRLPEKPKTTCEASRLGLYRSHDPSRLPGQRIAQGPSWLGTGRRPIGWPGAPTHWCCWTTG